MLSDKTIKAISVLSGFAFAIVMALIFSIPGLLLGAIVGTFGAMWLSDFLHKRKPENRRRMRRMLRNEGLG